MERIINGTVFDVSLDPSVIPLQIQVNSGTVASNTMISWPATIAATGSFTTNTNPVLIQGLPHFALGGTLSQNGTVSVQAYLDKAAKVPVGAVVSASATASTKFVIDSNLGTTAVIQSIGVSIVNGGTSAATLSNPILVLQSA